MNTTTQNEIHILKGREIVVKREDLRFGAPYLPHGKTGAIIKLMQSATDTVTVACFASRGSDWAFNAAVAAKKRGIPLTIFAQKPSVKLPLPQWLEDARAQYDAVVDFVRPNVTQIMITQAKKLAAERGDFFIPFGFELSLTMDELTQRLAGGFAHETTLVLCAGSGVTLVCALNAALLAHVRFGRVVAVRTGIGVKTVNDVLRRHLDAEKIARACEQLTIIDGDRPYGNNSPIEESVWPTHPFYERKAYAWLVEHIDELDESRPVTFLNM